MFPVYFCVMEVEQIHMEQTVYAFEGILKFLIWGYLRSFEGIVYVVMGVTTNDNDEYAYFRFTV